MTDETRDSDLLRQRRANFDELVRTGIDPYPHKFDRSDTKLDRLIERSAPQTA